MDCSDCQHQQRCFPLLLFLHRLGYPCAQGRYIKGRGLRQVTLAEAVPDPTFDEVMAD
jgi:hypothetical protein